jgi:hypothetical protein
MLLRWIEDKQAEYRSEKWPACPLLGELAALLASLPEVRGALPADDSRVMAVRMEKMRGKVQRLEQLVIQLGGNPDQLDPRALMLETQLQTAQVAIRQLTSENLLLKDRMACH